MASRQKTKTSRKRHLWRENHGNLLAAFAGLILVLGTITILYQQMRFRPPAFPRRVPHNVDLSTLPDEDPDATSEPIDDEAIDSGESPEAGPAP